MVDRRLSEMFDVELPKAVEGQKDLWHLIFLHVFADPTYRTVEFHTQTCRYNVRYSTQTH
jgi:hypothetical protein